MRRFTFAPLALGLLLTSAAVWAHPHQPTVHHRPIEHTAVRFEGLTLGEPLKNVPVCSSGVASKALCYETSFDGIQAPPVSASITTVVLRNIPAFLPLTAHGKHSVSEQEVEHAHRGLASVIDGRIEEIKVSFPSSRAQEAAEHLVNTFPTLTTDEDIHLLIGNGFAVGFDNVGDEVVMGVFSKRYVQTLLRDHGHEKGSAKHEDGMVFENDENFSDLPSLSKVGSRRSDRPEAEW